MSNITNEEDNNMNIPNKEENKKLNENILNNKDNNYIIAEINIDKNNLNERIRIINSFEQTIKEYGGNIFNEIKKEDYYKYENEKEIKDNCVIEINNKKIEMFFME